MEKKYMAKAALGGYKEVESWKEASYVMLSKNDYNELLRERNDKSDQIKVLQEEVEHYRSRKAHYKALYTETSDKLANIKQAYELKEQEYSAIASKVDSYKDKAEKETSLNKNLIRVATERANKDRDLPKDHNGYLMISWESFSYRYNTGRRGKDKFIPYDFYRVVYQTPWDCSLSRNEIYRRLGEDIRSCKIELLQNDFDVNCDRYDYRYSWKYNNSDLNRAIEGYSNDDDGLPHIMSVNAKANVSKGLWEVTFITDFEPEVLEKHRKKYV